MPSRYDRFTLVSDFELRGDQARAIDELVDGLERSDRGAGAPRRDGIGQDLHHGAGDRPGEPADARHGAQQDAGRPALPGVPPVLSAQRRRVLRQLLRLLPARGLRAGDRLVHREGSHDQRRDRSDAAVGDPVAVRAARRRHRRVGVLHLRPGIARGVLRHAAAARARAAPRPRADPAQAGRDPVPSGTTTTSGAAPSGSAATSSRSTRRTRRRRCGSSCSATRSTSSRASIR